MEDDSHTPSHQLRRQPMDVRRNENIRFAPLHTNFTSASPRTDPLQHIRDRTMKRQRESGSGQQSLVSSKRSSQVTLKTLDQGRNGANRQSTAREVFDTPADTPADSLVGTPMALLDMGMPPGCATSSTYPSPQQGVLHKSSYRLLPSGRVHSESEKSHMDGGGASHNNPAFHDDQKQYHTKMEKLRKTFETRLNAVLLGEVIGDVIIKYYQGQHRDDMIATLTHATILAEKHGLEVLMARAQLWKALIFDVVGQTSEIPSILLHIFVLVRDHGDEMDCYQLRKLFPYYGESMWQSLMKQSGQKRNDSSASFTSQRSKDAFDGWYHRQLFRLEEVLKDKGWPDPFAARNAAIASRSLANAGLGSGFPKSSGNAALLEHVMRLENQLRSAKEREQLLQKAIEENERIRATQLMHSSKEDHPSAFGPTRSVGRPSTISTGRVTDIVEKMKVAKPRSRETARSSERKAPAKAPVRDGLADTPTSSWVRNLRNDYAVTTGSPRQPFGTPISVRSPYDRQDSDTVDSLIDGYTSPQPYTSPRRSVPSAKPSPLRIRCIHQDAGPKNAIGKRQTASSNRGRSEIRQRLASRSSPSEIWRNADASRKEHALPESRLTKQYIPSPPSNNSTKNNEVRKRQERAVPAQGNDALITNLEPLKIVTSAHTQPSSRSDRSRSLPEEQQRTKQDTALDLEITSRPQMHARRSSLPSPTSVSPLTIDPGVELPMTDTPAPAQLRSIYPDFNKHQEQRRKSVTVLASPDSTSYETERRISHALAGLKLQEMEQRDRADSLAASLEALSLRSGTGTAQAGHPTSRDANISAPAPEINKAVPRDHGNPESSKRITSKNTASSAVTDKRSVTSGTGGQHRTRPSNGHSVRVDSAMANLKRPALSVLPQFPTFEGANSESTPFGYMHQRKNSTPAIPSPLREAAGIGDVDDIVGAEKSDTNIALDGDLQSQAESRHRPNVSNSESLANAAPIYGPNIRDFAGDDYVSETTDLYGVSSESSIEDHIAQDLRSSNSRADATDVLALFPALREELAIAQSRDRKVSSARLSNLLGEVQNAYQAADTDDSAVSVSATPNRIEPLRSFAQGKVGNILSQLRSSLLLRREDSAQGIQTVLAAIDQAYDNRDGNGPDAEMENSTDHEDDEESSTESEYGDDDLPRVLQTGNIIPYGPPTQLEAAEIPHGPPTALEAAAIPYGPPTELEAAAILYGPPTALEAAKTPYGPPTMSEAGYIPYPPPNFLDLPYEQEISEPLSVAGIEDCDPTIHEVPEILQPVTYLPRSEPLEVQEVQTQEQSKASNKTDESDKLCGDPTWM